MIDHAAIVREIERAVGAYGDVGMRSTYNPKTKKYFGVSDYYVPAPLIWRHDLWNAIGESPATWDHVRLAAPRLKAAGHPIGIGQSNEPESNVALIAFMMCFGSFIQDESNALAIDSKSTVEAVQFMADLYKTRRGHPGLLLDRGVEQPVRLLRQGVDDPQRDLGRPPRRESATAGRERSLAVAHPDGHNAGSGWRSTRASTRSGSSPGTGRRPRGSSPTSASITERRRLPRSCSTSRASPALFPPRRSTRPRQQIHTDPAASTRSSPRSRRGTPTTSATPAIRTSPSTRCSAGS